ncbi:glutathione S-transferase family protein [Cardiobacteriaceae bacterium TAE3-ERU3]|nr:glutathione S-transferase family protein [Cardiobacteriaceae bacterium TAE3-ERU3]
MSQPNITFYTNPLSRGRFVRWMLEECGADYETVVVAFGAEMKDDAYLAVNPMGKVPALQCDDTVITETVAIIMHLADLFPDAQLAPSVATGERGSYYRWLVFAQHLEYAMQDRFFAVPDSAERRKSLGYGDFDSMLATLRQALTGKDYLVGGQFSAADLFCCSMLGWGYQRAQVLPPDDVFQNYMQRIASRPAFARAAALDDALIGEMPS